MNHLPILITAALVFVVLAFASALAPECSGDFQDTTTPLQFSAPR
jgi:hypothetical protein